MTGLMHEKEFSRKSFLKGGGAMIVGFGALGAGLAGKAQAATSPFASNGPPDPSQVDAWIMVHADNTASVNAGRVELGQGSSVGLAMIAAEELDMDLSQMKVLSSDTNITVNSGTSSASASIKNAGPFLRAAAVEAREALLNLASTRLGVPVPSLTVASGVVSGGGKSVTYGDLIGDKLFNVTMPASYGITAASTAALTGASRLAAAPGLDAGAPGTKPFSQYKLVGTPQPRFDIPDKVTGKFTYVHNIRVPGMLHARVVRPRGQGAYPSGAPIVSVDESSIKHIQNVQVVHRGDFLAVVAPHEYDAIQAAAQLKVTWADPPKMSSSGNTWKQMRDFDAAGQAPARITFDGGNVDTGLASAATKLSATYMFPYHGHLPIGPCCAVADVRSNGAVIFSNTQDVYRTRSLAAGLLNLPLNNVRVVYYEGSSVFGGAPYNDAAYSAALASQLVGKPVRLQFMRWDEHGWDNHGPLSMIDMRGGADINGKIVAHEYTGFVVPNTDIYETALQLAGTPIPTPGLGSVSVSGLEGPFGQQYYLPNRRVIAKSLPLFNNYLKTAFLRTVYSMAATLATEQFVDELAYTSKIDPVEFRRRNIDPANDGNRASTVLEGVTALANWQPKIAASKLQSGDTVTGRGIALGGISFARAAVVADVKVNKKTGKITVMDLWVVENAGLAVNPEGMHNQIVGMLTRGTSRALHESAQFDSKRVTSLDWVSYPVLRFKDGPRTHIATLQRPDLVQGGSSEATEVVVPAAIANAFFDATGIRIRENPMTPARVRESLKAAGVA